jgi:hypothetical protein
MRWTFLDQCLLVIVVLAAVLTGQGVAQPPPPPPDCVLDKCVGIEDVVVSGPDSITYFRYSMPDCSRCKCATCSCPNAGGQQEFACGIGTESRTKQNFRLGAVACPLGVAPAWAKGKNFSDPIADPVEDGSRYVCTD